MTVSSHTPLVTAAQRRAWSPILWDRRCRWRVGGLVLGGLLALLSSSSVGADVKAKGSPKPANSSGIGLRMPDLEGHDTTPLLGKDRRATVLLFITNDCPIANSYAPEIQRIQKQYAPQKFTFFLVYVDPSLTAPAARKHRQEYGYTFAALLDHKQLLAKRTGATITPEAAVLAPDGKLLYRGRIDDRYVDFGKARAEPTTRDLRNALDAIAQGKPVPHPTTHAIGCFLPPVK